MKYVKKTVVIEAIEWTGENIKEVMDFMGWRNAAHDEKSGLVIHTLEGNHYTRIGDMIIKGVKGEFYPCKPDIFALTYDPQPTQQPVQVPDEWQLVEQLADALRNVEEEMRLLSWQKSIELRRPANSFGIAVKNYPLALEWQEIDAKLQALYAKRRAALAAAQQPAQQLEEVLDGWMLVPVEPTFEMLKAIDQHGEYYSEESLKDAYMDMLSAAPQPKGCEHD